jgi:hypothetical protein
MYGTGLCKVTIFLKRNNVKNCQELPVVTGIKPEQRMKDVLSKIYLADLSILNRYYRRLTIIYQIISFTKGN